VTIELDEQPPGLRWGMSVEVGSRFVDRSDEPDIGMREALINNQGFFYLRIWEKRGMIRVAGCKQPVL
jgi:hypothetical protein